MKKDITATEIITQEKAKKFSGNFLFSFLGFFLCITAFIFWKTAFQKGPPPPTVWLTVTGIFMFFYWRMSTQTCYFFVSDRHLLVKNQLLPWVSHIYLLEQIKELTFITTTGGSNSLKVMTVDGRRRRYYAGSIRIKTWDALEEKLGQYNNIDIRHESTRVD